MAKKVFIGQKEIGRTNTGGATIGTSVAALSADGASLKGGVQIVAASTNASIVYVGTRSTLTAGTANATDGFPLSAGDSIFLPVRKESDVYCIADAVSQQVYFASH